MQQADRKLSRAEWSKTPYAGTESTQTEADVMRLLMKYNVSIFQWTQGRGPSGRPAIMFRFELNEKPYKLMLETLNADAPSDALILQVKRVIYWHLKSLLEMGSIFMPLEKALFAFLELPDGGVMFESVSPYINQLKAPDFARLMLPAPKHGQDEVIDAGV